MGICHSSVSWGGGARPCSFQRLLCLLQLSPRGRTSAAQALLKHVGICRFYPLVVVLFRLNDLKAKLLVEVDCRLVADLHMTVRRKKGSVWIKGQGWRDVWVTFSTEHWGSITKGFLLNMHWCENIGLVRAKQDGVCPYQAFSLSRSFTSMHIDTRRESHKKEIINLQVNVVKSAILLTDV